MGLSIHQLLLLDNLIYLRSITKGQFKNVRSLINYLLYNDSNPSNGVGTGTILDDWFNVNTGVTQRDMSLSKWVQVLQAIERDETLCNLEIYSVTENTISGLRAATFIGDDESIIIFREPSWDNEFLAAEAENSSVGLMNREIGAIVTFPSWFKLGHVA